MANNYNINSITLFILLISIIVHSQSAIVPFSSTKNKDISLAKVIITTTTEQLPETTEITLATTDDGPQDFEIEETTLTTSRCSPSGYPCVANLSKRNDTAEIAHLIIPCCSGTCQFEPGWIDAVCE